MAVLRRVKTLAVIVVSLLSVHWLTPALQCKSPVAATSESKEERHDIAAAGVTGDAAKRRAVIALDKLPLHFEANGVRRAGGSRFTARTAGLDVTITPTDAVLHLRAGAQSVTPIRPATPTRIAGVLESDVALKPRSSITSLRMRLVGANRRARVVGEGESSARANYFIGDDATRWQRDVPQFARVRVERVYRSIDVVYYGSGRQLEYDFNVAPGASSRAIRLAIDGADKVRINRAGELVIKTKSGEIRQPEPVAYQEVGEVRKRVASRYEMRGNRVIGFHVSRYDRRKPLVIDPVLVYSTLIGGTVDDSGAGVAVDASGNVYVTGKTDSITFPTTSNAFEVAKRTNGSDPDVFVTKLNAAGTGVVYSTFIGGSDEDASNSIAVDSTGAAYLTGRTRSADFPTTAGTLQPQGGGQNAFVVKLTGTGAVAYSTYLGGNLDLLDGIAEGNGIAVDTAGNAYVTGLCAFASAFPITQGAYQTSYGGGSGDAFVTKLNPTGTAVVYSTFLGGNGSESARGIAVDFAGNAYVTGVTGYSDTTFPRTKRAFQRAFGGGALDAFVTKLNSTGTALVYSTLLGGSNQDDTDGNDSGFAIAVDSEGSAYVTGSTGSRDFPTTPGAFQTTYGGGRSVSDVFVTKINPKGTALVYSTYLGGSEQETGYGIAIDSAGNAYVTGGTSSSNFPMADPLQRNNGGSPAFKSTDGGSTWVPINDGLATTRVVALAIDPHISSTIYAGTDAGVFKSTSAGMSWSVANAGLSSPSGVLVRALAIDPQEPSTLYVSVPPSLFKSSDGGSTWRATLAATVGALAIDPRVPSTVYAGAGGGVLKSTNAGNDWQVINTGLFIPPPSVSADPPSDPLPPFYVTALVIDPANTSTLYCSTSQYGSYKSTNGGASWINIHNGFQPIYTSALLVDAKSSALFAGAGGGVIRSADGGVNWSTLKVGLPGSASLLVIDPAVPATLYCSVRGYPVLGGLFKTLDGGNNWRSGGLSNIYVFDLAIDPLNPSTLYAGGDTLIVLNDAFVTKLNAAGAALVYSTYFGGHSNDFGFAIAVDSVGNGYVIGASGSANFRTTPGAFQSVNNGGNSDAFIAKISSPFRITGASIKGKKLFVTGDAFGSGAVIILNREQQMTENDETSPTTLLVARKAGKKITVGQPVTIQVRNLDGTLSNEFTFVRPAE